MNIEVIDSLAGLEDLRPEWSQLHRDCPRATPFQSPHWLIPWTRHLFGGGEIWTLAIRDKRELVGLAPLFCWGTQQRTVSFLGAGISDYGDLLFAPERERECVSVVWKFLTDRRERWNILDLQELRCGSGLLEGQRAEKWSVCPVLDLSTYPESMDHKHRTDVRRAWNKLKKRPELQLAMACESNFSERMEEFIHLYEVRWGTMEAPLRRFHEEASANFLAAGLLRLCSLRVGGVPAAAIYSFATGATLYCYLSGFDPALAKLSPGAVLLCWLVEQAISGGMKEVDFLRHPEAYKYLWGARDRINFKLAQGDT